MIERPNSVITANSPLNRAGTVSRRIAAYSAKVGATSSLSKLTGRPPPMSTVVTCRRPTAALISRASATALPTPPAISSSGQPCEPTWVCTQVSQGRAR